MLLGLRDDPGGSGDRFRPAASDQKRYSCGEYCRAGTGEDRDIPDIRACKEDDTSVLIADTRISGELMDKMFSPYFTTKAERILVEKRILARNLNNSVKFAL